MRFIPTRIHGMLDYPMGVILIAAPYVLGFADGTAAQYVPMVLGVAILLLSLVTRYELGAVPLISMQVHLMADVAAGVVLAISPFLFGFSGRVWVPHVVLGLLEIGAGLMTRTAPDEPGELRSVP